MKKELRFRITKKRGFQKKVVYVVEVLLNKFLWFENWGVISNSHTNYEVYNTSISAAPDMEQALKAIQSHVDLMTQLNENRVTYVTRKIDL